jgi:hypothetical protein
MSQLFRVLGRTSLFVLAWLGANMFFVKQLADFELRGYILIFLLFAADIAWQLRYYSSYRGFITDRRIVVVKSLFPVTIKRMTLFWKDAVKARDIARNFVWRMLKIGTLEISARLFQGYDLQHAKDNPLGSEIQMRYVKYFVEITNYIDTLIHLTAHHPEKISKLSPLVLGAKNNSEYSSTLEQNTNQT